MHPLDKIARVCHEVNRAYCQALGDNSQPAWEDAPAWQREQQAKDFIFRAVVHAMKD